MTLLPSSNSESELSLLHEDLQKEIEAFLSTVIELEKEGYHNDLVAFSQHAAEIREKGASLITDRQRKLKRGKEVLKELFEVEGNEFETFTAAVAAYKENMKNASFEEEADKTLALQEQIKLPWTFMNHGYQVAKTLIDEEKYEDAECLFLFLHFLRPDVFEYVLGQAVCQQAMEHFEEAINSYRMCLQLEPTNPVPFFLMASSLHHLQEIESCKIALDYCIELAEQAIQVEPSASTLLEEALQAKKSVQDEKVA